MSWFWPVVTIVVILVVAFLIARWRKSTKFDRDFKKTFPNYGTIESAETEAWNNSMRNRHYSSGGENGGGGYGSGSSRA